MVRPGDGSHVVEINTIYSSAFIVPGYAKEQSMDSVSLGDFGKTRLVVPISMLKEHVDSPNIRPTPVEGSSEGEGRSKPAHQAKPPKKRPTLAMLTPTTVETIDEEDLQEYESELTSDDISSLAAAIFPSQQAQNGKALLKCKGLADAPNPSDIKDKRSVVMGDVFHAMDRTKVLTKHEAKKGYFVALRDAFLVWNPEKKKELEDKMREGGMSDEEIRAKKYYKSQRYRSCVDRHVPTPKILYWRVRAVYALYGNMVDSKTQSPLFNAAAWKKADNVLQEILGGFYSDPPGFELYTKRLREDGTVMTNLYDMELLDCWRGTNRTEAYHKNLVTTFGSWHTGIEMSDYLLAERRHRHNHKVSEKRRLGFPKLGHFDTWKIDQLQNLTLDNHGIQIFPNWSNASDYKTTNESFDTIALHSTGLHDALETQYTSLPKIRLTRDQKYMCKAMGTNLPFLPFVGEKENKQFAKYVLEKTGPVKADETALDWCRFVDGKGIHAKLPSHIRSHITKCDRNQRIRELVRNAKSGIEKLNELNQQITPIGKKSSTHDSNDANSLSHSWGEQNLHPPLPVPEAQALHGCMFVNVGGICVGELPKQSGRKEKRCMRCVQWKGAMPYQCPGRGGESLCMKFNAVGELQTKKVKRKRQCKRCFRLKGKKGDICKGRGGEIFCEYYVGESS